MVSGLLLLGQNLFEVLVSLSVLLAVQFVELSSLFWDLLPRKKTDRQQNSRVLARYELQYETRLKLL